jgi:phosphoglycerol transferase MdoB-like AlkP superfamily enzyme
MHFSHSFFTSPSLITKILKSDKFEDKEFLEIRPEHKKLLKTKEGPLTTSSCFSACKGANVILITMESLGDYIAKDFQKDKVKSRILERFKANAWSSKNHYCLCPNTTVSTNQIYSGGYSNNPYNKESSLFKGGEPFHIKELKKAGYKTLFLDSADISLYDYKKLLDRIGFDKVWGTHDLPSNGHKGDYRLLNMVDDIAHEVGSSPFYLHVINDQTHMPYEVINEDLFSKHKGKTDKTKYLNAVDEVDHIFDEFLNLLEQKIDLFNTIIMFTGDHGESFGEHGYSFHSNSIIQQQMKVPFMMFHPNLQSRIIEHSCHFDIFPTIFDLLGINTSHCFLGNSIALTEREYSYMFYSATLKGNSPANFAFMQNGEMLWVDRLFNQVKIIKDNGKLEELSNEQQDYACAFLKKMLEERNLIS